MIIAVTADQIKGHFNLLKDKVEREGITFLFEPMTKKFSWARLVEWELGVARRYPDEFIVFVDAWDFIMLGKRFELERIASGHKLLYHSETKCWPEPHKADYYPALQHPTSFKYVNGTGPAGMGWYMQEALEYGIKYFPIRGHESSVFADNDQRFFTDLYLAGYGDIDSGCDLSVSLNSIDSSKYEIVGDRIYVPETGSRPVFVHLNGAAFYTSDKVLRQLGVK